DAGHPRAIVVAVRSPERRELIAGTTRSALAPNIAAMTAAVKIGVDLGAATGVGSARRVLFAPGAGAPPRRPPRAPGCEPAHVGGKGLHLAASERKRTPIHAAFHAAVDPILQRVDIALAPAILRKLSPNAGQRHCIGLSAGLQMTVLASEVVAGEPLRGIR